mmetsp:Transcript_18539/g.38909  ORF Transcript_18539/g.38909 Transcript_18539/m.38909 type:complete len:121 (-) Transcript_18539:3719-4081(-)
MLPSLIVYLHSNAWDPQGKRVSPGLRCRPCPAHGICGYGRLVICLDGYVPHRGISCVVDRRLARMVDTMFRRVSFELHRRAGDVLCGFRKDIWMSRTGLIQFLDGQPLLRGLVSVTVRVR